PPISLSPSTSLRPPPSTLFPYTTLFRSLFSNALPDESLRLRSLERGGFRRLALRVRDYELKLGQSNPSATRGSLSPLNKRPLNRSEETRLNSSHVSISYAVFCLKKKKKR